MDERRKWKNVNTEEGRMNYRRMRNELIRATEKAENEYVEYICKVVIEFRLRDHYDLTYTNTKELGWKETQEIQNIGIEYSQGNRIVDQKQVLKIWENYVTELCYRSSVDPRYIARLEVSRQRKIPMTPSGIEPSAQFPIPMPTPCPHQYMYRH